MEADFLGLLGVPKGTFGILYATVGVTVLFTSISSSIGAPLAEFLNSSFFASVERRSFDGGRGNLELIAKTK